MDSTRPRKLVLCFDGTGNKFRGDDSDSNILKIFRMLDRTAGDQYHYYQPGIGTYVVSKKLSNGSSKRLRSWYKKAKDSAIGTSFDEHVVGGYRFLMRFYNPGDEIYMFGFSRGAYIARFLAEMLDHVGLLSHGNEEMVRFAWKAFSQWQCRRNDHAGAGAGDAATKRKHEMYAFLKDFRETFSRPVRRIRFLGLFDTVNSVPQFETAWMARSKFPYTARSSAKVIRHAVAIDERRARFRHDLIYQSAPAHHKIRTARQAAGKMAVATLLAPRRAMQSLHEKRHGHHHEHNMSSTTEASPAAEPSIDDRGTGSAAAAAPPRGRRPSRLAPMQERNAAGAGNAADNGHETVAEDPAPYRAHSRTRSCGSAAAANRHGRHGRDDMSEYSHKSGPSCASQDENGEGHADVASDDGDVDGGDDDDDDDGDDDETADQDVLEAWFAGGHGDTGGGWPITPGTKSASHVPLAWMVREAMRAGLAFDAEKVVAMGCSDVLEHQAAPNLLRRSDGAGAAADAKPFWQTPDYAMPAVVVADMTAETSGTPVVSGAALVPPTLQVNSHAVAEMADSADSADSAESTESATAAAATATETPTPATTPADDNNDAASPRAQFHAMMHKAHLAPIHDSLAFGGGLPMPAVLVWRLMEYLPFRRMDLQPDGTWQPIRWPLPRGETRDVPDAVIVHGSVLRRMQEDPRYRPGNLIIGGGGRGCRVAPAHYGIGMWECIANPGDPIGELWARKTQVAQAVAKA